MKNELRTALNNLGIEVGKVKASRIGMSTEYSISVDGSYWGVYSFERHTFVD